MNKRGIEATKQKKSKKELNEEEKQDKLRKKKVKIASKLEKIETSVDEIIDIIDKDGIEIEEKEKITSISKELKEVKQSIEKVEEDVENANKLTKKGFNIFGITIFQIFAYFIIYSFLGFIIETVFAFLSEGVIESRQSFLYGPFCAIYGLGAVVMIVGLQKFKSKRWKLMLGGMVLGAITEYLVSLIGELVFNVKWWDYSEMAFNIHGRICATFTIAWGALGVVLLKVINPRIDKFINKIPIKTLKIATSIIMIFMLVDWLVSSFALQMFYVRLVDTHHIEIQGEEKAQEAARNLYKNETIKSIVNTLWNNQKMIKTFPNLRVTTKNGAVIYVNNLYKDIKPYYVKVFEPVLFESMEERMTVCNLSIEMGARGGLIAPDEKTFGYIKDKEFAPKGKDWDKALAYWKTLYSDKDATFDKEVTFNAAEISPRITYGTNPGMGIAIDERIPLEESIEDSGKISFRRALSYMGFSAGELLMGKKIDYVFLGSCTNGRIEDFRAFANLVKGHKKANHIIAWLVPGSQAVLRQIKEEGIDLILSEAGFEIRQPGCSACLAMNEDKVPPGKYAVSTSNRNFEGRQGPGARTILAGPLVAAATAITGEITDPRKFL